MAQLLLLLLTCCFHLRAGTIRLLYFSIESFLLTVVGIRSCRGCRAALGGAAAAARRASCRARSAWGGDKQTTATQAARGRRELQQKTQHSSSSSWTFRWAVRCHELLERGERTRGFVSFFRVPSSCYYACTRSVYTYPLCTRVY